MSVTVREEAEDQKTLGSFFKVVDEDHRPASSSLSSLQDVAITAELQSYLLSAAVDSEENPLFWWKEHAKQFPALSKLAQSICAFLPQALPRKEYSALEEHCDLFACIPKAWKCDRLVFLAKNL